MRESSCTERERKYQRIIEWHIGGGGCIYIYLYIYIYIYILKKKEKKQAYESSIGQRLRYLWKKLMTKKRESRKRLVSCKERGANSPGARSVKKKKTKRGSRQRCTILFYLPSDYRLSLAVARGWRVRSLGPLLKYVHCGLTFENCFSFFVFNARVLTCYALRRPDLNIFATRDMPEEKDGQGVEDDWRGLFVWTSFRG